MNGSLHNPAEEVITTFLRNTHPTRRRYVPPPAPKPVVIPRLSESIGRAIALDDDRQELRYEWADAVRRHDREEAMVVGALLRQLATGAFR